MEITFKNDKEAMLWLCARNIIKYRRGEIKMSYALRDQIRYFAKNATKIQMESVMDAIDFIKWVNED